MGDENDVRAGSILTLSIEGKDLGVCIATKNFNVKSVLEVWGDTHKLAKINNKFIQPIEEMKYGDKYFFEWLIEEGYIEPRLSVNLGMENGRVGEVKPSVNSVPSSIAVKCVTGKNLWNSKS